jgi:hypothetical protein
MTKSLSCLLILSTCFAVGCATASPEDYANLDCDDMRGLVSSQDFAASLRGYGIENDRGMEEIRQESGSPWAGRARTKDERDMRDERQALREAYRRKGCNA